MFLYCKRQNLELTLKAFCRQQWQMKSSRGLRSQPLKVQLSLQLLLQLLLLLLHQLHLPSQLSLEQPRVEPSASIGPASR